MTKIVLIVKYTGLYVNFKYVYFVWEVLGYIHKCKLTQKETK